MISPKELELLQASQKVCQDLLEGKDELLVRKEFEEKMKAITKEYLEGGDIPVTVIDTAPLVSTVAPILVPLAATHPKFFEKTFETAFHKDILKGLTDSKNEVIEVLKLVLEQNEVYALVLTTDEEDGTCAANMLDLKVKSDKSIFFEKYIPKFRWASVHSSSTEEGVEFFYFTFGGHPSGFNSYAIGCNPYDAQKLLHRPDTWNQFTFINI